MTWEIFTGDGEPRRLEGKEHAWQGRLPDPPPWRAPRSADGEDPPTPFVMTDALRQAINAALHLRRPLLLMGPAGMGKSSVVDVIARELELGPVLRWHITSKSVVTDGLYQYDALDRLHATQLARGRKQPRERSAHVSDDPPEMPGTGAAKETRGPVDADEAAIERFIKLGPLGTALADRAPRAVLIDEIDKSDLDLPGDLLNVIEGLEFEIPPLLRNRGDEFRVRGADDGTYDVGGGKVRAAEFPVIVFTSNSERTFPPPFLRRCVRFEMRKPGRELLTEIVQKHLQHVPDSARSEIGLFAAELESGTKLAINQLLELVHLMTGQNINGKELEELRELIVKSLTER
ncbi:ATPase AAA [Actinomadura cremea]|nr:ATPase AAA [Actinomadura cremea]